MEQYFSISFRIGDVETYFSIHANAENLQEILPALITTVHTEFSPLDFYAEYCDAMKRHIEECIRRHYDENTLTVGKVYVQGIKIPQHILDERVAVAVAKIEAEREAVRSVSLVDRISFMANVLGLSASDAAQILEIAEGRREAISIDIKGVTDPILKAAILASYFARGKKGD